MVKEGFLEVETPMAQTNYGGAAAQPFVTHHNDHDMDMFLRVSPEQSLKRVMCGGMESILKLIRILEMKVLIKLTIQNLL